MMKCMSVGVRVRPVLSVPPLLRMRWCFCSVCTTKCWIKESQRGGILAHLHVRRRHLFSSWPAKAATGGSLEAGTYAIQHARPAVQLVASKCLSGAKHRTWFQKKQKKNQQTHICSNQPHTVYLRLGAGTLASTLASKFENRARGRGDFSTGSHTGVHAHTPRAS